MNRIKRLLRRIRCWFTGHYQWQRLTQNDSGGYECQACGKVLMRYVMADIEKDIRSDENE